VSASPTKSLGRLPGTGNLGKCATGLSVRGKAAVKGPPLFSTGGFSEASVINVVVPVPVPVAGERLCWATRWRLSIDSSGDGVWESLGAEGAEAIDDDDAGGATSGCCFFCGTVCGCGWVEGKLLFIPKGRGPTGMVTACGVGPGLSAKLTSMKRPERWMQREAIRGVASEEKEEGEGTFAKESHAIHLLYGLLSFFRTRVADKSASLELFGAWFKQAVYALDLAKRPKDIFEHGFCYPVVELGDENGFASWVLGSLLFFGCARNVSSERRKGGRREEGGGRREEGGG